MTARERPDVALVGLGESSEHALELIDRIVREAACPVIALLHARDPDFVKEASKRGVFAHISDADVEDWQSSIDIVLRRFAEYHDLEGAFGRRALIERAKGILMERHGIDEASAFEMLREHSRTATASSSTSPPRSSTVIASCRGRRARYAYLPSPACLRAPGVQATVQPIDACHRVATQCLAGARLVRVAFGGKWSRRADLL